MYAHRSEWGMQLRAKDHVTHPVLTEMRLSFCPLSCPITVPFRSLQGLREPPASCKFLKHR